MNALIGCSEALLTTDLVLNAASILDATNAKYPYQPSI
jgi:hypothetical protein